MTERASRVALVTGGTGALGSAVATRLSVANHRVHVPWIVEAEASRLEEGWGGQEPVRLHEADVTDEAAVARLFGAIADQDGPVDVLANIVGGFEFASIEQTDWSVWMKMMHVNATTAYLCSRFAIPAMRERGWGRILNVAALPALTGSGAKMMAYSASKAAVMNLTTSLAQELKGTGITVNAIAPTAIDTEANRRAMPDADRSTWLAPARIAEVAVFLLGEDAGIVTGNGIRLARA